MNRTEALKRPYRGVVVSNNDPKKLRRVKCRVEGLLMSTVVADLPWLHARTTGLLGGRPDQGPGGVPQVGSELEVVFPFPDDVYSGFYTGYWETQGTHPTAFDQDYPNTYGHIDAQGTGIRVNMARRLMELLHGSGFHAEVDNGGNVTVTVPRTFQIVSEDGQTAAIFDMEQGGVKFKGGKGNTEHGGDTVTLKPNKLVTDAGSHTEKIKGGKQSMVVGGSSETVGGGKSLAVTSNYGEAIGGNKTALVAQQKSEIYGLGLMREIALGGITDTILAGNVAQTVTLGNMLVSVLAGTMNLTTGAGIMTLTSGAAMNLIAALMNETIAGAKVETIGAALTQAITAALTQTIGGAFSQTIGAAGTVNATGAYNIQSGAAIGLTAGAALNLIASGIAAMKGSTVQLGTSPVGKVVTTISDPIEDFITGAPKIGTTTVFAGP